MSAKQRPAPAKSAESSQSQDSAASLLSALESAGGATQRLGLAKQLAELRPTPVQALKLHLARARSTTLATRRALLLASGAEVPDATGRFRTPARQTARAKRAKDKFNWLPALARQANNKGLGEVLSDVAAIRALAASHAPKAGSALLAFAFSKEGLIYRDECGRYLRKMSPYSLPALIRGSQDREHRSLRRYADYQLERLDRQNAHKAFASAPTEELQIAIVKAFAESQYREAVFAVLDNVDHVAPKVRKATRAAWMEYVSGRPPPKPPERKLKLPNGKETEEEEPLWLDHRELANTALHARLAQLGQIVPKNAPLTAMTEKLFSFYDQRRAQALEADFQAGLGLSKAGKGGQAIKIFDRILAQDPNFAERPKMVPAFLARAKNLESEKKWTEAARAYGKVSAMAPDDKIAREALRKHHLARAQTAKAAGHNNSAQLDLASSVRNGPGLKAGDQNSRRKIMFFGGIAAVATSLLLLLLGLAVRRRQGR